jgi:hypothetical protein
MKFVKPFSSFPLSSGYKGGSVKELWRTALHDPAYLIMWGLIIILFIYLITL